MKRLMIVLLVTLLLLPVLTGSADAWVRSGGWHGGGRAAWHGGGWHGGGCCWGAGAFAFGLGVGALATAPLWYAPGYVYAAPPPVVVSPPPEPVYQAPQTYMAPPRSYWYYCQDPQGYYPTVPQCPGGFMTVVPPGATP